MTGDDRQRLIAGVRSRWKRYLGEEVTELLLVAVISETLDYVVEQVDQLGSIDDLKAALSGTARRVAQDPVERLDFGEGQLLLIFPPGGPADGD